MLETQTQRRNIPFCERMGCRAYTASASAAILHFQATRAGAGDWKNDDTVSFINKLITNTIDGQDILRLAGLDLNLTADVLDMRINGAFIRFECHAVDRIQQLSACENTPGLAGEGGKKFKFGGCEFFDRTMFGHDTHAWHVESQICHADH